VTTTIITQVIYLIDGQDRSPDDRHPFLFDRRISTWEMELSDLHGYHNLVI